MGNTLHTVKTSCEVMWLLLRYHSITERLRGIKWANPKLSVEHFPNMTNAKWVYLDEKIVTFLPIMKRILKPFPVGGR